MNRRENNRRLIDSLKNFPCPDCGKSFPASAMDFDHVRGVKIANVSEMLDATLSEIFAEVAKCELVCATCHRIRTENRRLDEHVAIAEMADVDRDLEV